MVQLQASEALTRKPAAQGQPRVSQHRPTLVAAAGSLVSAAAAAADSSSSSEVLASSPDELSSAAGFLPHPAHPVFGFGLATNPTSRSSSAAACLKHPVLGFLFLDAPPAAAPASSVDGSFPGGGGGGVGGGGGGGSFVPWFSGAS